MSTAKRETIGTSPSKRPSKAPAKPRIQQAAAKPRVKPLVKAKSPSSKPSLRFAVSKSLHEQTLAVLTSLEKEKDSTQHRDALASTVVELTDAGMDYYFLRPLRIAKAGFFVEQSASLGMAGVTTLLASVVRNVINRMDSPQLLSVCSHIRQLMK
jgi:hypothetical protein